MPTSVLLTHPLIKDSNRDSIIYEYIFELSDFTILKELGAGAFGTC